MQYVPLMASQIFADTHTFHSKIKKAAVRIIPPYYNLFPPPSAKTEVQCLRAIKSRAAKMLDGGAFLCSEVDAHVCSSILLYYLHDLCINWGQSE